MVGAPSLVDGRTVDAPLAERNGMAFSGSVVASGRGAGYVVATGMRSELGKIAEQVRGEEEPQTPLQRRMTRFAKIIGVAAAGASAGVFAVGVAMGREPGEMFLAGVALAVSAIPEGLPVVFTITLALGVRRMARRFAVPGILVRDPFDNVAVVRRFSGPVLILHGESDEIIPVSHAHRLHGARPDAELVLLPCGHNDCPRPWREVRAFLERAGVL